MSEEKKIFQNFFELGTYLQKKRRETGERIEAISSRLIIKKNILKNKKWFLFKSDLKKTLSKGFLKTYMKDLGLLNECDIENLFISNSLDIKKSSVSLDNNRKIVINLALL